VFGWHAGAGVDERALAHRDRVHALRNALRQLSATMPASIRCGWFPSPAEAGYHRRALRV